MTVLQGSLDELYRGFAIRILDGCCLVFIRRSIPLNRNKPSGFMDFGIVMLT